MTSRLGDLLTTKDRLLRWDGLWGVMTVKAGQPGGTGGNAKGAAVVDVLNASVDVQSTGC